MNSEVLVLGGDGDKKGGGDSGSNSGVIGNMMGYFKGMRDRMTKGKGDDDDEVIVMTANTGGGGHGDSGGGGGHGVILNNIQLRMERIVPWL